ncbi:hypothetical protein [Szabonella alba]|uniref:Uncharacterized protein n=1 Tax=Szabonella alba TaxID=2804194 RepID=A0A8K0VCF9_9RHOB|nr:hypothetical protein [Szabonella alba]MBL4919343.1 hypothetical protein [Szabonella alba]
MLSTQAAAQPMAALPAPDMIPPVPDPAAPADRSGGRATALDRARARWEHGDWAAILALDTPDLENDPEREKLALLLAAAHSHAGGHAGAMDRARQLARQALLWGASRTMTARVLLSAAQNSLARAAAALQEDPTPHFEAAILLVQPHADAPLLARSRRLRELAGMGLLPDAAQALEQEMGLLRTGAGGTGADPVKPELLKQLEDQLDLLRRTIAETRPAPGQTLSGQTLSGQASAAAPQVPKFNPRALETYTTLDPGREKRFLYLDVKSLPRTGLHFMRNTFESLLGEHFSFCEWYNEPGCCRQMPCAVTGYATEVPDIALLRMIKSHDFDLTDPAFPAKGPVRRLILLRDPLYLLTSWWTLQMLYAHGELLKAHGIAKMNINFAHGPHVVRAACRVIDAEGSLPSGEKLATWLDEKSPYILGFVDKWARAVQDDPQHCRILRYDDTPGAVLEMLKPLEPSLPKPVRARIDAFRSDRDKIFKARQDPFHSQSRRITEFLHLEADRFRHAAETLCRQDRTGLLAGG